MNVLEVRLGRAERLGESGETVHESEGLPSRAARTRSVPVSQSVIRPGMPPPAASVAMVLPSGERARQRTGVGCLGNSSVTLRLVSVSPPGTGRSARDYTAVSEVSLMGTPAA